MLHDPSHRPQPITTEPIQLQPDEKEVLRRLVAELAQVAELPVHREKAELWRRLNDLESERPQADYFKVRATNDREYLLKHDLESDEWFLGQQW